LAIKKPRHNVMRGFIVIYKNSVKKKSYF